MRKFALFCLFLVPPVFPAVCRAEGGPSLGLGYPYLSLKYDFSALAAEGRYVTGSGVEAYTARGYWNFYSEDKLKGFAGLEGGYIKFNTLNLKGTGSEGALFVGGEYSVSRKLSLMMDFAPTLISLNSGKAEVSGLEYVVNLGLYFRFGELLRPAYSAVAVQNDIAARRFFEAETGIARLESIFPKEMARSDKLRKQVDGSIEAILLKGKRGPRYDYALGFRRYQASDWEAAALHLKAALGSETDKTEVAKYLAAAEEQAEKRRQQLELERQARTGTLFELANRTFEEGDYERAGRLLDEILRLSPYQPASSLKNKISAAIKNRQAAKSARPLPSVKEKGKQAPDNKDINRAEELYYQAIRDYAEGKLEKALKNLRQGLSLNPGNENLKSTLDRIEREMKQK